MDKRQRDKILTYIVERMKDGYTFSEINKIVIKKFSIDEHTAYELVQTSFNTVSFLDKEEHLRRRELFLLWGAGLIISIFCALVNSFVALYSGLTLLFMPVLFGYIIGKFLFGLSKGSRDISTKIISATSTLLSYLLSEYVIFVSLLKKEIASRGIFSEERLLFILKSIKLFFNSYLLKKSIYEFLVLFLGIAISISFFTQIRIKRIRR